MESTGHVVHKRWLYEMSMLYSQWPRWIGQIMVSLKVFSVFLNIKL